MPKSFIISYIKKLSKNDFEKYIKKNNINASNKDIDIVYNYMQKYCDVFFDNPIFYINKLKGKISDDSYNLILNLYNEYKNYL